MLAPPSLSHTPRFLTVATADSATPVATVEPAAALATAAPAGALAAAEPGAADATDPVATADGATPVATAVTAAAEPAALAAPPTARLLPTCGACLSCVVSVVVVCLVRKSTIIPVATGLRKEAGPSPWGRRYKRHPVEWRGTVNPTPMRSGSRARHSTCYLFCGAFQILRHPSGAAPIP